VKYTLDADVLIGALDGADAHHARARTFLAALNQQGDSRQIGAVNLAEV
jgi:predicted nucleic acid-binding protein